MNLLNSLNNYPYCIEVFVATLMFMACLKKREYYLIRVGISFVILFLATVFIMPVFSKGVEYVALVWFLSVFLVCVGLCGLCCEVSLWDCILTVSLGYSVQHLTSSLYLLLIYQGNVPEWSGILYWIVYVFCYIICYFLLARNITTTGRFDTRAARSVTVAVMVISVFIVLSFAVKYSSERVMEETTGTTFFYLFRYCQLYSICVSIFMICIQRVQQREQEYREKLILNNTIWQQRQQQYQSSRDNIDAINRKCHDLKHQIAALAISYDSGEKKQKYIQELQNMIEVYDTAIETGNEVLDALMMERGLFCHMHDIDWTCVADGHWLDFVDVVDLYTILGNALDNAQEAVLQIADSSKRTIAVRIWKQNAFIVLQVENSYVKEIQSENGRILTTKQDKQNHGIGINSIRSVAEKYHGTVSIKAENQTFLLNVLLPLQVN
ncbi:MAG: ATP-binding protein [Eubacteriales bacterium]|nr:ATP-binding protein [Eubacteriales bacterium]